tara:strand:- start:3774 stop:3962 length:189 start_codon:yes stop_codon:yes gene_type:complete
MILSLEEEKMATKDELEKENKELKIQNDFMLQQLEKKTDDNFKLRQELIKLKPNMLHDKKTS